MTDFALPIEYLELEDLIELAERLLGNPPPIRDMGLLGSAVARPRTTVGGEDAYPDIWTKAAALLQSIVLVDAGARKHVTGAQRRHLLDQPDLLLVQCRGVDLVRAVPGDELAAVLFGRVLPPSGFELRQLQPLPRANRTSGCCPSGAYQQLGCSGWKPKKIGQFLLI